MSRKTKESKKSSTRKEEEAQPVEEKVIYGDISTRLFASMLDLALVFVFVDFFSKIFFSWVYPEGSEYMRMHTFVVQQYPNLATEPTKILMYISSKYPQNMQLILDQLGFNAAVQMVLVGIYIIPMTKKYGATIGKMTMGLRVVDDITGKDITWSQAVIRYIAYVPSLIIVGLGLFAGMASRKKRCWHDHLADTYVIRVRKRWYTKYVEKVKTYFHLK